MFARACRFVRVPVVALLCAALVVSTPGCSLFASDRATLTVTATDPAAEIWIDGAMYGTGTVQAGVERNRSHTVMAKVGDRVGTRSVGRTISTTGVLDIIGGFFFLFPFLGILGDGFWDPEEEHVTVVVPHSPAN
jgi:hypothetical protein